MYHVDVYDGLQTSLSTSEMDHSQLSESSSLSSSFLNTNIGSRHPVYIHADSLVSLDDMIAEDDSAEIMAFKNTSALCDDLRFISGMPEVCDIKFLVGHEKVAIYGVKAILSTRCRAFYEMVISAQKTQGLAQDTKQKRKKSSKFLKKLLRWRAGKSNAPSRESSHMTESNHLIINIHEFNPDTFRRIVLFLHCGTTSVSLHSVIGVMNAADTYGVEDLRAACYEFALRFVNLRSVLKLLLSTDGYCSYKLTKMLVVKIFEFIERNGRDVLSLPEFETLPQETAVQIVARPELRAAEEDKWDAALRWSKRHSEKQGMYAFQNCINPFIPMINFIAIPLPKLRREIRPLSIVPDDVINRAIVQQASTRFVIGQERRASSFRNAPRPRRDRQSMDSITWARSYIRRRASINSTFSESSRAASYDSGFASSDEGCIV